MRKYDFISALAQETAMKVLIFVWEQKCLEGWRKKMKVVLQ